MTSDEATPKFHYSLPARYHSLYRTVDMLKDVTPKLVLALAKSTRTPAKGGTGGSISQDRVFDRDTNVQHLGEDSASCFAVDSDAVESLADIAASLQLRDQCGKLSSANFCVGLLSPMRCGDTFLDEIVVHVAKELSSDLISIGQYDLDEIAIDFYDQEQKAIRDGLLPEGQDDDDKPNLDSFNGLRDFYFAQRIARKIKQRSFNRCMDAFAGLLGNPHMIEVQDDAFPGNNKEAISECEAESAPVKEVDIASDIVAIDPSASADGNNTSGPVSASTPQNPPTIVHIRDVGNIMAPNKTSRRRLITRVRDAVKTRRGKGENFIVFISLTHTDALDGPANDENPEECWKIGDCECWMSNCHNTVTCTRSSCELGTIRRKLDLTGIYTKTLMPSAAPRDWLGTVDGRLAKRLFNWNMIWFKNRLRPKLSHYEMTPPTLLEERYDWSEFLSQDIIRCMSSRGNYDETADSNAIVRVIGRCVRKRTLQKEDIQMLLAHLIPDKTPEEEQGTDKDEDEDGKTDGPEKVEQNVWKQKIEEIEKSCSKKEKELLTCAVDPAELRSTFDVVVLDQEVTDTIKTLVYLSRLQAEGASEALLSLIQIKGVLLYGPPGTGKTHLARAVAKSAGSHMLVLNGSTITSMWVGETEKNISAAFSLARKLHPCIIFIDEVDSLFYRRTSNDHHWERAALTQFLQEMDGITQSQAAPFVLVATNRPGDLDSAFIRRLPQRIPFGLPNVKARADILRTFLKDDDLDGVDIDNLASLTGGYSGSDLKSLCGEAGLMWAIEQQLGLENPAKNAYQPVSETQKDESLAHKAQNHPETPLTTNSSIDGASDASTKSPTSPSSGVPTPNTSGADSDEITAHDEEPKVKVLLQKAHFMKALDKIKPSVSIQDIKAMEDFHRNFNSGKSTSFGFHNQPGQGTE
ncbi:hypothetical protein F5Y18DRAFT_272587 [Xylariaceae sp. FL1019]|nr:hypothetical protein F5Y18DRAFT_272587 [Xylariaceae sp. FL1019]